jgi:hypothetical protein
MIAALLAGWLVSTIVVVVLIVAVVTWLAWLGHKLGGK